MSKEQIRIAHIVGKWVGGGVEAVIMNYYRYIDRNKIQFDFICDSDSTNIPYEEIEKLGGKVILIPPYQKIINYHRELKKVLKKGKYKIVHSHINTLSIFPLYAAKRAGIPIRIAHSHSTTNKKEWKKNLLKQVLKPLAKGFATDYFCCSEYAGRWLFGNKVYNDGKVYLLNNAIDLKKFKYNQKIRNKKRKELKIKDNQIVIGHIGRFVQQKNHDFLIDIFKEIHKQNKNTILLLAGQGPEKKKIKEKVKELHLSKAVKFLGQRNDANELYQAFDIFLLPSLYEGLPVVGVEAQASGLLCILSNSMTKETKVLETTKMIELNRKKEEWATIILKEYSQFERKNTLEEIKRKGFDIQKESKKLEKKYFDLLEKIEKKEEQKMKTRKKVGIVSCYFKHNYGSMLQAYATQEILDELGIENETINIDLNKDFKKGKQKFYLSQLFNLSFIRSKLGMIKLKIDKKLNHQLGKNIQIRDKKYEEFRKKFHLTKPYKTYRELNEQAKNYHSILVGSDQLWLPVNIVADYYTLNWVPDNINKVSYATSFGISTIPKKYEKKYKKFLNRISHLSVREQDGVKLIKKITGKTANLVCDPTLLLDKSSWQKLEKKERIIKEKYILCYFLGKNKEHRKFAERLKKETGYQIVSLNHADEYVKYSDIFADITPYNVGPREFLNLIHHAEWICTDSFHGTVFSLIYNKMFYSFRRYQSKSKMSTNSRIDSLLEKVGLKERIIRENEEITTFQNQKIDYKQVNQKLEEYRTISKKFLENSLK